MNVTFNKLEYASLTAEWFFFLMGVVFCFISILGNGYVSYRLMKIIRVSRAIQTPIYLSLTISGFCTGVFCMPYMLYLLYVNRIVGMPAALAAAGLLQDNVSYAGGNFTTPYIFENDTSYFTSLPANFHTNISLLSTSTPALTDPAMSSNNASHSDGCILDAIMNMTMFDRVVCNLSGTVFNITSRLIVWLMLLLSVDRYIFICHPYRIHLVKKQHYGMWIALSCVAVTALSFAPYVFYYPDAGRMKPELRSPSCPKSLYQPYRTTRFGYSCDSPLHIVLNMVDDDSKNVIKFMVYYVFTVVFFLIVPIFLNVILSFKVLYEVSKMKKVGRTAACTVLRQNHTIATSVNLNDPNDDAATSLFMRSTSNQRQKNMSILRKISIHIGAKITAYQARHVSSVIENKASFTMLVLSLFYIVTYFAWVLVWSATIVGIINIGRAPGEKYWIFLYHSENMFAYNIVNHYPQATFANAAFVPCLLGYSLHRGKS